MLRSFAALLLVLAFLAPAAAQEWTRFRGPNGTGVVTGPTFPATFSLDSAAWVAELPGTGHSCPVAWGERIFLLSADPATGTRHVLAIDRTDGSIAWQHDVPSTVHHLHDRNTFASSTPAVDAGAVYVAWATPERTLLAAYSHDGTERWSRDLGSFTSQHGFGASPIVVGDRLFLFHEQQGEELPAGATPGTSRLMAFDRRTGETLWETPTRTTRVCYSVPCLRTAADGSTELVTCNTGNGIFAVDPETGKIRWQTSVFDQRTVASPVLVGDLVIGSCGSGAGANQLVAVRPDGNGAEEVFRVRTNAGYVPTPVVVDGLAYVFYDKGVASCIDTRDGSVVWKERLGSGFSGSPIAVGDRIYVPSDAGIVYVLRAGRTFELLGENDLGETIRSTPGLSGDLLLIRTLSKLIAIKAD